MLNAMFSTLSLLTLKTNYNLPISRIREKVVNFISRLDLIGGMLKRGFTVVSSLFSKQILAEKKWPDL